MESIDFLTVGQRLKKLYRSRFSKMKAQWNLKQNEIDILLFLARNPGYDTAKDISVYRQIPKSQVSQSVENLIALGFLEPHTDPFDRRCIHLHLCEKALPAVKKALDIQTNFRLALVAGISDDDKAQIQKTMLQIIENAERELGNVN